VTKIGFVGLGTMGAPMACNLLRGGFQLRVHDLNPDAVARLEAEGAKPCVSAAEAAREADAVITMLPNGEHVEAALLGEGGALAGASPGALVIDMSTILPLVTDRIASCLVAKGFGFVDAPVGRSSQHSVEGKLLIMVGGEENDVRRARPILEKLGDTVVHCGPAGAGSRMKIVNNFMSITLNVTTAEALTPAEASGQDPELARQVMLGTVAGQGHMGTTYPAKVLKSDLSRGFMIDLAAKDLGLALRFAAELGIGLETRAAAKIAYHAAQGQGRGRQDWTSLYQLRRAALRASKTPPVA
jgi:4-hydroxybutyrate dehydrogenase/sulfolactaldehyde 3-reductase